MFVHVQMCLKSQHCPRGPNKPCSSPPVNYTTWKSGFNWFYLEQQAKRDHNPDHRPHSRQIIGARCTEVAARQSWAEYSSRPTTHSRRQGWAIKDFSVLSEMCSICEQPLYGIMLMILHTNNWYALISDKNLEIFFKSIWKIPSASGHSRSPFTSCRARPSWHNGSSLGPHGARVEWLWVNDFSHKEYHIWQAWPSTCWHLGDKLPKYEVPVLIAQTRNHWRKWKDCASVPKNGLPNWCD